MILRKISRPLIPLERRDFPVSPGIYREAANNGREWSRQLPLRWRLSILTAVMVLFSVGAMTVVAYVTVSASLTASMDRNLQEKADSLLSRTIDPIYVTRITDEIDRFKDYNPDTRISVSPPGWGTSFGDVIPIGGDFQQNSDGGASSIRTIGGERVLATTNQYGAEVALAQDMSETHQLITSLGVVLLAISAVGVLIAVAAGMVASSAGLRPLARLQRAVDHVTRTDELRPIEVVGKDELAHLTRSFNAMLRALQESRTRQTQLVADAGHELKTPLTSMRTNIELLMMINRDGASGTISKEDRSALKHDVLAQMEELSTLIGDLVDLAREDGQQMMAENVEMREVLEVSLDRVKRRRPDVEFELQAISGELRGDPFALGRAVVNLMDNAAKWSPPEGRVRIRLSAVDEATLGLTIADSGPGIPQEDRERVFERFYRSVSSRSMPGSGLGLSIVQKVIERHGGSIVVDESDDGGTLMRVTLPGMPKDWDELTSSSAEQSGTARQQQFAERWMKHNQDEFSD